MSQWILWKNVLALFGLSLLLGCSGAAPNEAGDAGSTAPAMLSDDLPEEVAEALAKLSPEDRESAIQQRICPVTEMALGSMDVPPKVSVAGREVFLCCAGCEEELARHPEYLAKLEKH